MDEKLKELIVLINKLCGSDIGQLEVGDVVLFKDAVEVTDSNEYDVTRLTVLSNAINRYSFETGRGFEINLVNGETHVTVKRVK